MVRKGKLEKGKKNYLKATTWLLKFQFFPTISFLRFFQLPLLFHTPRLLETLEYVFAQTYMTFAFADQSQ